MSVFVVGQRSGASKSIRDAVERATDTAMFVPSIGAFMEAISTTPSRCVLADTQIELRALTSSLRSNATSCGVPVIALLEHLSEPAVLRLHAQGVDDVVRTEDYAGITRRVAALQTFDPDARTAVSRGRCLLAHPHTMRRQVVGRLLRQAGFDVTFAESSSDFGGNGQQSPFKLIVASDQVFGRSHDFTHAMAASVERGIPVILLKSLPATRALRGVHVVEEEAPVDDLLFVVNELFRPRSLVEGRASRRLLHATLCAFRGPDSFESRVGLTYNISREGLYVRTFDAPPQGSEVWLEMRLGESLRTCHLRGEVAWTRNLATGALGAAPPGFGVRLKPEACPPQDYEMFVTQYDALLHAQP